MEIKFNAIKEERKKLVAAISGLTGWSSVYKGAPSFAFAVNNYVIDKDGTLIYDERVSTEDARTLLIGLIEQGFVFEGEIDMIAPELADKPVNEESSEIEEKSVVTVSSRVTEEPITDKESFVKDAMDSEEALESCATVSYEAVSAGASDRLVIEVPATGFGAGALDNLEKLVTGKSLLIMKSIGTDSLPIEKTEDLVRFPWFQNNSSPENVSAYTRFVYALCEMAKKQKRVTLTKTSVASEKYAFRCFLLRLGFIGDEYKNARKILLSNLSGSGSFKKENSKDDSPTVSDTDTLPQGDCLSCGQSMSEPGNDTDGDCLFCVEKQTYVDETGVCLSYNA